MAFVSCPTGLEPLLAEELTELGARYLKPGHRGIEVEDDSLELLYRILYGSRLAARLLIPIRYYKCKDRDQLYQGALKVEWKKYLSVNQTFAIDVHGQHPAFRNTLFAAQVVKDAICDQMREEFGKRPSVEPYQPDLQIHLYLEEERVFLSLDAAGIPLHKRGYRRKTVPAPLQENLAAAIVRLSGYRGEGLLCDPCCGSGTLLIEAAMVASRTPAGFYRTKWGIERLPNHDEALWQRVRTEMNGERRTLPRGQIIGIDSSPEAIVACRANLEVAGFAKQVELVSGPFQEYEGRQFDLVISNPPLGKRLEIDEALYRDLGHFLRRNCARPSRALILCASRQLAGSLRLPPEKRTPFEAGGLRATLLDIALRNSN